MGNTDRGKDSKSIRSKNPDRGPPMMEGAHSFNKGYESDESEFSPYRKSDSERGNDYFGLMNKAVRSDSSKMQRQKFSKIA